jgi:hypothetical protein
MMIRKLIITIAAITTFGCTSTYNHLVSRATSEKLDPELGVLISTPEDGSYGDKVYRNSGRMTSNAIMIEFSKFTKRADITEECKGNQCLNIIETQKYGYYVEPKILHWEDRNTEWSGKSDRINIQLTIFDALSKRELAKSTYAGKSKWGTFGGDHPQDLLPEPTRNYVESLYSGLAPF